VDSISFEENRLDRFYGMKCAGRLRLVCCDDNIERVEQLALSLRACVKAKGGQFEHKLVLDRCL